MDLGISGKRAAVAASSAGLGLSSAMSLASEGVRVAICGRRSETLESAAAAIRAGSGASSADVVAITADVSSPEGAEGFVGQASAALGGIDILVANAGGPSAGTFDSTSIDDYRTALDLNLLSTVAMCRAAVPSMLDQEWGRVVAITSIGARQPIGTLMASSTARAGVTGFLKVLAGEVASSGVTVNSVLPGIHRTDRLAGLAPADLDALSADVPSGVLGNPADFGEVVAFLCSQQANFITGTAVSVDGGATRALL